MTRRSSMLSAFGLAHGTGDETIRWSHHIIQSAVHSVNALTGTKAAFADRNHELRKKLEVLFSPIEGHDQDGSVRNLIIPSKELHDELTSVVKTQQDIIEKPAHSASKSMQNATQTLRRSMTR